jgi:cell division protein FtsQ
MTAPTRPPARRPRIDPRIRQRRIDVIRQEGQRRLRLILTMSAVVVVLAMAFVAAHSPLLAVRHVRVAGGVRTSPGTIVTAAELSSNMLDVDTGRAVAAIDQLPWVATAAVHRHWPATVTITVTERTPVALVGPANALMQVDSNGRVLGPVDGRITLPVVALGPLQPGVVPGPVGAPGTQIDAIYAPGIAAAAALPPALLPQVTGIVVAADATVTVGLVGRGSAFLGPAVLLGAKISAVAALLDHGAVGSGTVDVTVPDAPVVRGGP